MPIHRLQPADLLARRRRLRARRAQARERLFRWVLAFQAWPASDLSRTTAAAIEAKLRDIQALGVPRVISASPRPDRVPARGRSRRLRLAEIRAVHRHLRRLVDTFWPVTA